MTSTFNIKSSLYLILILSIVILTPQQGTSQSEMIYSEVDAPIIHHQSTTGPIPPPEVKFRKPKEFGPEKGEITISGVPPYLWRHGCGPTAVGMVVGYYDTQGYSDLVPGNAADQTGYVNQAIASQKDQTTPQHYEDYSLPMEDQNDLYPLDDKSEWPSGDEHKNNCIADYMHTSWSADGNFYGWSWSNKIGPAFTGYVNQRNSNYAPAYNDNVFSSAGGWNLLKSEVDANHPLVFLVDTDGNGRTDHFVTVIGYRDTKGYREYCCLDTWQTGKRWERLREMSAGNEWGIYMITTFRLYGNPNPTPTPTPTATPTPILSHSEIIAGILNVNASKSEMDVNQDGVIDAADIITNLKN
mgnify:CR=1 FL=1